MDYEKWENEQEEMDGQALQTALQNAYAVAEGYGMDVPRLKKLYELSKLIIRRAEFPQFCGSGRRSGGLRAGLSAPWKGAELQWESN